MNSKYELAFFQITQLDLKPLELVKALKSLENDIDNVDFSLVPLDFLSACIHKIFLVSVGSGRASLIRIISEMEMSSTLTIVERYHLDKLIALSIDQRPPDVPQKVDEEKLAAFKFVSLMLKYRHRLPPSILRAMVSIYQIPKHSYKNLIISYFLECCLTNSNIEDVPEIGIILADYIMESGNDTVVNMIQYAIENKLPFICAPRFASRFISPIAQMIPQNPESSTDIQCQALIKILKSWSALLSFGFQQKMIVDLLRCLPHSTDSVIYIFRELLKLGQTPSVLDAFTGLILFHLIQNGLIDGLNELSTKNSSALDFLSQLLPFVSQRDSRGIDLSSSINRIRTTDNTEIYHINCIKCATSQENNDNVTSITNFVIPSDQKLWDWRNIIKLLTVVFPHDELEAKKPNSKTFFIKIFDAFSTSFFNSPSRRISLLADVMNAFIAYAKTSIYAISQLESHSGMKSAMENLINSLEHHDSIENSLPHNSFLKLLCLLMTTETGISCLKTFDVYERVLNLGTKCTNINIIEIILKNLQLYPSSALSIDVFQGFVSSNVFGVHQLVMNQIRYKKANTEDFTQNVFVRIIIPHIKSALDPEKLSVAMNLFAEIIYNDPVCLSAAVSDHQLHEILSKKNKFVYSVFFSKEESFAMCNVGSEIMAWIETHNRNYVKAYDMACEVAFCNKNIVSKYPHILFKDNVPIIAPHLFGTLSRTKSGIQIIRPYLDMILEKLETKSIREKRATFFALAHFASSPLAAGIVEDLNIVEVLFKCSSMSDSNVLRGTLMVCLSLFYRSPSFYRLIHEKGFQVFIFGERSCVIPMNPESFIEPLPVCFPTPHLLPVIKGMEEGASLLRKLSSALTLKKAKEEIKTMFKEKPSEILSQELSLYGHELMSFFNCSPDARFFIQVLYKNLSMMSIPNETFDQKVSSVSGATVLLSLSTDNPFSFINIPTYSYNECRSKGLCLYADVFLSDVDFEKQFSMKKSEFYSKTNYEIQSLRYSFANLNK